MMKPKTYMQNAYRAWCEATFPNYHVKDFPCSGRMYQVWEAAWYASMQYVKNRVDEIK
jgi:hypothetical protein